MKKKKVVKAKKSYYKPKKKTNTAKAVKKKSYYKSKKKPTPAVKKKYKSYYKPKKKLESPPSVETILKVAKILSSVVPPSTEPKVSKRPVKYLNNRDLLSQVLISKELSKKKGVNTMSNELAKMLILLCARYGKKGNFANYCVDDQTQALTKRGWLSHKEITVNDTILSYDVSSGNLIWSKILDLYSNKYTGKMHHLTTEGLDALVTPNHKLVSLENGIKPVEDIICNEHIVLMGNPVQSDSDTLCISDDQIRIVGWAVTEGHYIKGSKNKRAIVIAQKQGVKADSIRSNLTASKIPFIEYTNSNDIKMFHCTGTLITQIYDIIAPNKVLSMEFIINITNNQRKILIETMVSGDGWSRPSGGMSYIQKDKDHVDAFLALCTISGQTTGTTLRGYKTPSSKIHPDGIISECYTTNIYTEPKKYCKAEWIDFHGGKQGPGGRREDKPNLPTQDYDGIIWCPQTEYGTFVCRRNAYIYVTGNTYNDDMQGYAMMMLVKTWNGFDPAKSSNPFAYFTQAIKNSFIQYLNMEQRHRDIRDEVLVKEGLSPSFSYMYDYENQQANADLADQEVQEAPTKLHEDVEGFNNIQDTNEEESIIPDSY